jgi:hypothetical protein
MTYAFISILYALYSRVVNRFMEYTTKNITIPEPVALQTLILLVYIAKMKVGLSNH